MAVKVFLENSSYWEEFTNPFRELRSKNTCRALKIIFAFSAHAGGSQTAFELAEQMAERNVPDSRIMNVINLPGPATTLSLEEQQIEQSLQRLDDRLLTLQESLWNSPRGARPWTLSILGRRWNYFFPSQKLILLDFLFKSEKRKLLDTMELLFTIDTECLFYFYFSIYLFL